MAETRQETQTPQQRGRRQRKVGVVVSNRMQKTVVVAVERLVAHSMYGKRVRRTSKFLAHDETNQCRMGDRVAIVESRPYSARKRWRVASVVKRAATEEAAAAAAAGEQEGA